MNHKAFAGINMSREISLVLIRTVLLLLLFFLLTSQTGFSQSKSITIDGRAAILHPNGKWEFVKKSKKELEAKKECAYSKNQIDNIKGTVVKVLERERIVSYTSEELKKIYADKDYITMDAYLSNFNKNIVLFLKITIRTNNPHTAYGSIYKDDKLIIKFKNGQTATLYSGQSESGNVDYEHDVSTYMTFFQLNDELIELLQSSEAEMARLYWSKSYEDYKIINPDFFIRQLQCVK